MTSQLSSYLWQPPGKSIAIELSLEAMDRIDREVMSGFNALPRRGAEVGGILLGRKDRGAQANMVIEDIEPVPCEYRYGPSYHLSDADQLKLGEALARLRVNSGAGLWPVGFFRSHTRDDLALDDKDLALISTYFSDPQSVFLLVKPLGVGNSVATFCVWQDGRIERESTEPPFPFGSKHYRAAVQRPEQVETPPVQAARAVANPEPEPRPPQANGTHTPPSGAPEVGTRVNRVRPFWLSLAAALLFAIGFFGAQKLKRPAAPAPLAPERVPQAAPPSVPVPPPVKPSPLGGPVGQSKQPPAEANAANQVERDSGSAMTEARALIGRWASALKRGDQNSYVLSYAPTLEAYFTKRNVPRWEVKQSVARMLTTYGRVFKYDISDLHVAPEGQNRVIATFRKHWETAGPRKFAGEELERLVLTRSQRRWAISSEQELKVFWVHKDR